MAEDSPSQEQKAFDPETLAPVITDAIKAQFAEWQKEQQQQQEYQRQKVQEQDPLAKLVAPYLAPVQLQAQAAIDAATFYTKNPQASRYTEEIEQIHQNWLQRGITVTRGEVWNYVKGLHSEELFEERRKELEQKERAAQEALTVGPGGSLRTPGGQQVKSLYEIPYDKWDEVMRDVVF